MALRFIPHGVQTETPIGHCGLPRSHLSSLLLGKAPPPVLSLWQEPSAPCWFPQPPSSPQAPTAWERRSCRNKSKKTATKQERHQAINNLKTPNKTPRTSCIEQCSSQSPKEEFQALVVTMATSWPTPVHQGEGGLLREGVHPGGTSPPRELCTFLLALPQMRPGWKWKAP